MALDRGRLISQAKHARPPRPRSVSFFSVFLSLSLSRVLYLLLFHHHHRHLLLLLLPTACCCGSPRGSLSDPLIDQVQVFQSRPLRLWRAADQFTAATCTTHSKQNSPGTTRTSVKTADRLFSDPVGQLFFPPLLFLLS